MLLPLQDVHLLNKLCHRLLLPLQIIYIDDLQASVVLLLESPQSVFLLTLPLEECLLDDLLVMLVKDDRFFFLY